MNNLLIYYGWLNSFNSAQNQWNNEKVAQDMAKYDVIVMGDGIQDPNHGDYSNTQVIIPRIMELNPEALIFGYVTVNQNLSDFKSKTDKWVDLNVQGIFMDEAGYDYGKKRDEFNERVAYVHSYNMFCFANSWNADHVIGTANDSSYPNSTYNPNEVESLLEESDWYLLESFSVNTTAYSSSNGFASKSDLKARGDKAVALRKEHNIYMAAVGIINDSNQNGQTIFNFSHRAAQAFDLNANGTSDTSYGASSASTKFWNRPNPSILTASAEDPSVTEDVGNSNILLRYTDHAKINLDFTSGSETSSVTTW